MTMAWLLVLAVSQATHAQESAPVDLTAASSLVEAELVARYGEGQRARLHRGLHQTASLWRTGDGDAEVFMAFVRENFIADSAQRDAAFNRLETVLEQFDGHMHEIGISFLEQTDLDRGDILPLDRVLSAYDPSAHASDDFFRTKLSFIVLLNFPLTTLDERLASGGSWSRRQWAEARLAQRFGQRVPAGANEAVSSAAAAADQYISEYNIWMHHLLDDRGRRLFPSGMRLISHWNLRDEIKADYRDPAGLAKQRMIVKVMERIVSQTIPAIVIDNPTVDWNPSSNDVRRSTVKDADRPAAADTTIAVAREADRRYALLLDVFRAERMVDQYSPSEPTLIARRFDLDRELPEARVRAMLEQILSSPRVKDVAALISARLGRRLEPFDIWYNGFRPSPRYSAAALDSIVARKYPTAAAFQADIPRMLQELGFSAERAQYVASKVVVDPARGAGHAVGAARRGDRAHLRTRIEPAGMNYKGYNIAVHELGHTVEQTFSLYDVDHQQLAGVPNNAFTEALAFVFQGHDLDLLGLTAPPSDSSAALTMLDKFWATYEIAGVSLVDMALWHWMYEHPDATPAELREATLAIARDVWNRYYAPVLGQRDEILLGVYSHIIEYELYLPDYAIGQMIATQVEAMMAKAGRIGPDFERVARLGRIGPDAWMTQATGAPVGPEALLTATERALARLRAPHASHTQ